jgi:hypothetical protein
MNTVSFATPPAGWPAVTAGGVAFPNQAIKMYIVSSSRPDYLLNCSPNSPNVQVAANNYGNAVAAPLIDQLASWIKAVDPVTGFILAPGTAVENWLDSGHQFLHVKIVDLRPLFCRVELYDTAAPVVVDMANNGSGYSAVPSSTNINGTTISYQTNSSAGVLILNYFSVQRQSGLTSRTTNASNALYAVPGSASPATNRITTPGAPEFEIRSSVQTIANQQTNFYVIKGTILRLISPTNGTSTSLTIQKDCQFEYFGGNWRQLY